MERTGFCRKTCFLVVSKKNCVFYKNIDVSLSLCPKYRLWRTVQSDGLQLRADRQIQPVHPVPASPFGLSHHLQSRCHIQRGALGERAVSGEFSHRYIGESQLFLDHQYIFCAQSGELQFHCVRHVVDAISNNDAHSVIAKKRREY